MQTVCRQVLEDIGDVEIRGEASFRNWLLTVAERRLSNKARWHAADRRDADREVASASLLDAYGSFCSPSRAVASHEEVLRIERAMDELSDSDRDVILQLRLIGRDPVEVAAELGCSEEALRQRLARARARLALALEGDR